MTTKEILKEIKDKISDTYFKIRIGFTVQSSTNGWFLIPTIEIYKNNKYFEVNIWIIGACCLYITMSKESYKEDES